MVASIVNLDVGGVLLNASATAAASISQLITRARSYNKKARYSLQTCVGVPIKGEGAASLRFLRITRTA